MSNNSMSHEHATSLIDAIELHGTSGTDVEPASTPHPMWMDERAGWQLMFHGNFFVNELQQTGPRGGDKFFSTNWFMPMAQHQLGPGKFTARVMLSLEPATVTDRRYPELFQIGETAFGLPIVDGQHPHDFFMEIGAFYDWNLNSKNVLSFYAAPVGDPALGPVAYPHRTSASEDPIAVLGHHMQDSTHIADEVVTVGYAYSVARIEVSGFHGREPNEGRWNIDAGAIDSWSARLTLNPARDWSGQFSLGTLHSPEALDPTDDQRRMTASITYNRPFDRGNWASSLVWGRTRSFSNGGVLNSYLLESTLHFLAQECFVGTHRKRRSHKLASHWRKSASRWIRGSISRASSGLHGGLRSRNSSAATFLNCGWRTSDVLRKAGVSRPDLWPASHGLPRVRAIPPRRLDALNVFLSFCDECRKSR